MSTVFCGCDKEANHMCERHRAEPTLVEKMQHLLDWPASLKVEEVRITDPTTGGQKGSKLARFSLIPAEFLWALAEHYGIGAKKYDDRNWERGYKWSLSQDAHDRHFNQWLRGEDKDQETGTNHLIAAAWHLVALYIYQLRGLGTDDIRSKS